MAVRIQMRRDTLTNWSTNNPTLAEGEMGLEKDTGRWKVGNGVDAWNTLSYSNSIFSGPSSITDNSAGNALRITQLGTGNALVVEDSVNPDSTPFVINSVGNVGIGTASPSVLLDVSGVGNFSGNLYAPTASVSTNTTQVATTAFVIGQASTSNPLALGSVAQGTSTRYSRQDHVHPTTGLGLTSGKLSQFAATTSAELAGVISDETGSGSLVFSASPAFTGAPTTPNPTIPTGIANKRYVDTVSINVQTASYSLALTDSGKLIEMNSSSSNTVTIPLDSSINFDIGTSIDVYQYGTGQTTIAGDIGVTIRSSGNKLNLTSQYSAATLVKRAANDWVVMGDLS